MQSPLFLSDPTYLLLIAGALFVHASYQLSVSVLTHFSSHSLSRRVSKQRLLVLGSSYTIGAVITTGLILIALVAKSSFLVSKSESLMMLTIGLAPVIGLVTILWYYRNGKGTRLWLPRIFADYLLKRSKKTKSSVEAAMLGAATVVGELPFLIGPLLFIAFLISNEPSNSWAIWAFLYSLLAYLPLMAVTSYLTSGHSVAKVQRWREENKAFFQWTSGVTLIVMTVFLTVMQLGAL